MKLVEFIKENKNWKELLSQPPYSLKIKEDEGYTLFMYNQIESDFYNPIVKESRGVILDLAGKEPRVVCRAFDKFGNYGEGYVDEIDWASARVQEKVDGSICKLWYDKDNWHISSNGCIDAFKAELSSGYTIGDLFFKLFDDFIWDRLDKSCTYIFELVSPYNKVVINYGFSKLYLLGKRNNKTGEEMIPEDLGMVRPREYSLGSLEDCIRAAEALNPNEEIENEGFVVVDKNFHRIKIKSPAYVAMHHVVTSEPSLEDMIVIWQRHEEEEFLTYFPQYAHIFEKIKALISTFGLLLNVYRDVWEEVDGDKKSFALALNRLERKNRFAWLGFDAVKYNDWSVGRITGKPAPELARILKKYID